ncbi:MAG: DUF2169 domain-containing protein [Polyangiaceae bacterium]
MKVIKPLRLGVLYRVLEHRRRLHLSVAIVAFFPFQSPTALLHEQGLWPFLAEQLGAAALDAGMPKARREILVTGSAFPPNKAPAPACRVRVQLGPIDKSLLVFGDRHWKHTVPSDPVPFTEMPITYENAFGGPGFSRNPIGKGFAPPEERGAKHLLPNVEDPKHPIRAPNDRPPPAGLGPYDPMWPQRKATSGTYDDRWLADVYPGFPDDMDWSTFNTAPEDQRTSARLTGDEVIRIENMHPHHAVLESRLPGIAARCFVTQRGKSGEAFLEIGMAPETVHLFPNSERGVVLFRGTLEVTDEDAGDVLHLMIAAEHLGKPKPIEHYRRVLTQRLDRAKAHLFALRDQDLLPERDGTEAPPPENTEIDEMKGLLLREGLLEENQRRRAQRELDGARERLREQGIDPDTHGVPKELPPEEPTPDLEQLPDYVEHVEKIAAEKEAEAEQMRRNAEEDARRTCEQHGLDYEALQEEQERKQGGPPKFSAEGQMEHLREVARMARNAGVDLPHVEAQLADPGLFAKLQQIESKLREVYVRFAHEMPPAQSAGEEARDRARREVESDHAAGRSFQGQDLTGMSLAGMDLRGADFRDALLEAADLSGADLRDTDFSGAVLARGNLSRANLKGAKLRGTNLGRANLTGARAEKASAEKAILYEADLSDADFSGADLTGADLTEARFRRTSFIDVQAASTNFLASDLSDLDMMGANLAKSNFIEVVATGASFRGATLTSAVFVKAKASGADLSGADLTNLRVVGESVFEDAQFQGANLRGASLRATRLSGSDFTGAQMDGADLSESDLRDAKLHRVSAKEARFVKANLENGDLSAANLMSALLQRADLRGANLSGSNLFRADLLRVRVDGATRLDGAETGDLRFVKARRDHEQG